MAVKCEITVHDTYIIGKFYYMAFETAIMDGLLATIPPSVYPRKTGKKVGAALVRIAASHTYSCNIRATHT